MSAARSRCMGPRAHDGRARHRSRSPHAARPRCVQQALGSPRGGSRPEPGCGGEGAGVLNKFLSSSCGRLGHCLSAQELVQRDCAFADGDRALCLKCRSRYAAAPFVAGLRRMLLPAPLPTPDSAAALIRWPAMHSSARALALAQAAAASDRLWVIAAADARALDRLREELRFFLPQEVPVLQLPDWEVLPYDRFSPLPDLVSERLATLARLPLLARGVLLVSVETLMQRLRTAPVHRRPQFRHRGRRTLSARRCARAPDPGGLQPGGAGQRARRVRAARLAVRRVSDGAALSRCASIWSTTRSTASATSIRTRSARSTGCTRCGCCPRARFRSTMKAAAISAAATARASKAIPRARPSIAASARTLRRRASSSTCRCSSMRPPRCSTICPPAACSSRDADLDGEAATHLDGASPSGTKTIATTSSIRCSIPPSCISILRRSAHCCRCCRAWCSAATGPGPPPYLPRRR